MNIAENAPRYQVERLTSLSEHKVSFLLSAIAHHLTALVMDCPDLELVRAVENTYQLLHTFISHTDPDHFPTSSPQEVFWQQPVYIHPLSRLVFDYIDAVGSRNGGGKKVRPPKLTNIKLYEAGQQIPIEGIGTFMPLPLSHGTFLHGGLLTLETGQKIFFSPDNGWGKYTDDTIRVVQQILDGDQLDLLIADGQNWGRETMLTPQQQWVRMRDLIKISQGGKSGGVEAVPYPCPVILYIKRGHVIQLLNWLYQGFFEKEVFTVYMKPSLRQLIYHISREIKDDRRNDWIDLVGLSQDLETVEQLRGKRNTIYITDDPYDQARYDVTHVLGNCSRKIDYLNSTENEPLSMQLGLSGHSPKALREMFRSWHPKRWAVTHNGSSNAKELEKDLAPTYGTMVLKGKHDTYQF